MPSFEEIRAKAEKAAPRRVEARVLLDQGLLNEHAALEARAARAVQDDIAADSLEPTAPALVAQLTELEDRIAEAEDVFAFEPIGTAAWRALIAEHPPTEEQRRSRYDHNPDTFQVAAIARCCVDPVLSLADAQWLRDRPVPIAEWNKLWLACAMANQGVDERPKSVLASVGRHMNGQSPGTPPSTGSLADVS